MSKDPFVILGVDENTVNQNELYEAYRALRATYEDDRFLEGEAGEFAARKISEIDQAYNDAYEKLVSKSTIINDKVSYTQIENKIREKDYNEAQDMLDSITDRDAEWHFLQSVIYYKKGWISESLTQLEKAVQLDPNNARYKSELEKLRLNVNGPRPNYQNQNFNTGYDPGRAGYNRSYQNQRPVDGGGCDLCSTLCALDCCCECMGGDFIACC